MPNAKLPSAIQILEHLPDSVYLLHPDNSNILWCNRAGYESLGLSSADVLHHSVLSLQKDVTNEAQWNEIADVIRSNNNYTFIGRHRHADGSEISVEIVTRVIVEDGQEYFLSVVRDVSKRVAFEQDLNDRSHQLRYALNEAIDGLWDWDLTTNHVFFSPQLKSMLGYGPDEMPPVLESWSNNIHPEDLNYVMAAMQDHLHDRCRRYEAQYRLRNRNGHYLWVHDRGRVCARDANQRPTRVVGMLQNISDQKKLQHSLEALATHDVLTQLPNRRKAESHLSEQLALAKRTELPFCVGVLDLDKFKEINDVYGHQKGDDVLITAATLLRNTLRITDFVARWGGEEFLLLLPNTQLDDCPAVLDKLHQAFRDYDWQKNLGVNDVTFSLGIASYPKHHQQASELIRLADRAMYRAKELGRNQSMLADAPNTESV